MSLKDILIVPGMEEIVRKVLEKLEKVTEGELQDLWEFSLD